MKDQITAPKHDAVLEALNSIPMDAYEDMDLEVSLKTETEVEEEDKDALDDILESYDTLEDVLDVALDKAFKPATAKPKALKAKEKKVEKRVTYYNSKNSAVLVNRIGDDNIILEYDDEKLSPNDLAQRQQELLELLDTRPNKEGKQSIQKKSAEKIISLLTYMKNGGKFNEVMRRTFKLLMTKETVTRKDIVNALLSKPYSKGTAAAQTGQMMEVIPVLKLGLPIGADAFKPNPQSVILNKLKDDVHFRTST